MGQYESPEAAYLAFLDTFNARDLDGWAGVNSYPHARVSAAPEDSSVHWRPPTRVFASAEEYVAAPIWDELEATGWVHSVSTPPLVVQSSTVKAHIAGGWTRYDADETAMASNRVVYVATKSDDGWGLQGQLKIDSFVEGQDYSAEERAGMAAVESVMTALAAGNVETWLTTFHYPLTMLAGPGEVRVVDDAEMMRGLYGPWCAEGLPISHETVVVQAGKHGANVAQTLTRGDASVQQLFLVGERGGVWKPVAVSVVA